MSIDSIIAQLNGIGGHVVHKKMESPSLDEYKSRDGGTQFFSAYDLLQTKGDVLHLFYVYPTPNMLGPHFDGLCVSGDDVDTLVLDDELLAEGRARLDKRRELAMRV